MRKHYLILVATIAAVAGYCAATLPARAQALCQLPRQETVPHVFAPEDGPQPLFVPDSRRIA